MRGLSLRFLAVLALVLATWNPEGRSFVHWVLDFSEGITPPKAFLGTLLTIGWVAVFVASWRSLGVIGTGLLAALVGTGLWALADWAGASLSGSAVSYLVLVSIALVLAVAMSWRTFRAVVGRRFGSAPPPQAGSA